MHLFSVAEYEIALLHCYENILRKQDLRQHLQKKIFRSKQTLNYLVLDYKTPKNSQLKSLFPEPQ